jgi:hypothetical protein
VSLAVSPIDGEEQVPQWWSPRSGFRLLKRNYSHVLDEDGLHVWSDGDAIYCGGEDASSVFIGGSPTTSQIW